MKKRSLVSLLSAFFIIALASCSSGEEGKYEIREIDLYRKSNTVDKKLGIRFYNDNPNVPYIGVKEYFKEFYNTELQLEKENYNFSFKKADETYLKIDTKNEVLEIKGIYDFSRHPDFHSNNEKIFLHLDNKTSTTKQSKAIDLKNYSINTYASHNDAYVPIALLGNLYGGILGYNVSYNGKELYVLDDTGELSNGESRFDEYYCDTYFSVLSSKEKRHEDLAKYNYNQLCFTFDNLRGYTTQLVFGDHNLQTVGLNALLETYYPDIKRMLLSTERSDYDKGIMLLFGGLYDGGHTGLLTKNPPNTSYYAS